MSSGPKPTFLMPMYDAQELRRRMAVCFTIGELYRLAEKLGVPATPAWSNSPQDASRDIVRHFDRSGALPFLVEALQEAKPLVEWPEPLPPAQPPAASAQPAAQGAGPTQLAAPVPEAFDDPGAGDRPTPIVDIAAVAILAAMKGSSEPPQAPAPPASGGFAPVVMPKPGEAPAAPPAAAPAPSAPGAAPPNAPPRDVRQSPPRGEVDSDLAAFAAIGSGAASRGSSAQPASGPVPASPAGPAAWPATVRPGGSPAPKGGLDYRIVAGAGAAVLVAVAIAFLVGRASSAAPAGSGADQASTSGEPDGDRVAISQHVVEALSASLGRVAKDCQIDLSTLRGRPLFRVAYDRCGPLIPQALIPQQPPAVDPDPVLAPPPSDTPPDPPQKGRPAGGNKLQKVDTRPGPATGGSGCLTRCSQSHGACTARCGAEPKQGSQYDVYQACLGGCLKSLSQCKLGCQ